jgi:hypothetical protein
MPAYRAPRGTRDLLPDERVIWTRLERLAAELAARYGYREIQTPMFEQTAVFERGLGEATDAVEKELFRLVPRKEEAESWALRPEPTAGIVRAYIQHGMQTWPQPVKLTLVGPMFRYDRPQAGRHRQFWQFDVEAIGDPGPAVDAEIIELALRFYRDAGLADVELALNSIGDAVCRPAYVAELVEHYRGHADALPEFERERLERNPLRLLDSKDPAMAEVNAGAPRIVDRLCQPCADHFASLRGHLDALGIVYRLEPGLVSTTTPGPRSSSSPPLPSGNSRRSAAAVAMTAWSSSSVAARRRASASGSGSTGSFSRSRRSRRPTPTRPARSRSWSEPIRAGPWSASGWPRHCARRASGFGPSSASASSAVSSRPRLGKEPISRSSWATRRTPARSSCATSRPGLSGSSPSPTSLAS